MPIYEYVCTDCQAKFESYVSSWGKSVACPRCSSEMVKKQLSSFAMTRGGSDAGPGPSGGSCCGGSCGCAH